MKHLRIIVGRIEANREGHFRIRRRFVLGESVIFLNRYNIARRNGINSS